MMIEPTKRQTAAIIHPPGPLLIIAGAGSGKTTTLILRIEHMIDTGQVEPESIVVVTFTERAVEELAARIDRRLGSRSEGLTVSTFHGLCRHLVEEYSASPNAEKPLIQENDIVFLLLDRYDSLDMLTSQRFKSDPIGAVTDSFIPVFNRIRDELLLPRNVTALAGKLNLTIKSIPTEFPSLGDKTEPEEYLRQFHDLVKVYETYQGLKNVLGVVDYSDMVVECWEMLQHDRDTLQKVRKRYRHIVVDEYQDNNYALNQVMGLIAGDHPDITVVGDEDQCIYSFRGANYYNVYDFKKRYGVEQGKGEIWLEENHRSTQEILDVANLSIESDRYRTPKKLKSAQNTRGPKPVWHVGDKTQTLEEIPRQVYSLLEKGYGYGELAVLCRTWNQVRSMAGSLEQAFIPVDMHEEHFFENSLVKDVLAWANLLYDRSQASDALFRILKQLVGSSFAESFFRNQATSTLRERVTRLRSMVKSGSMDHQRREMLSGMLETHASLKRKLGQKRRADEMVWEILDSTDLLKDARHGYRHRERLALANAGRLLSIAEEFEDREKLSEGGGLDRWLRYMDILSWGGSLPALSSPAIRGPNGRSDPLAEAGWPTSLRAGWGVQVMTIHSSKGLEFSVVMIPFLQSGSLPLNYTRSQQIDCLPESWYRWKKPRDMTTREERINEERRIFFVGLTRAKKEIHLFGPEKRQSLFMKEILERSDQTLEIKTMPEARSTSNDPEVPGQAVKQKILVALNRELSSGQYTYAHQLIDGLKSLEEEGKLPDDFPLESLSRDTGDLRRSAELTPKPRPEHSQETSPPGSLSEVALSASSAEEYDRCSYKYRLKQIDRVPERKSKVQMEFGIIIHRVLEEFHRLDPKTTALEGLLSLLDKHWRTGAFEYEKRGEEFKRQGKQMLTDYFQYFKANRPEVVATEARFDFVLDELKVRVTGKIDRVDREGDTLSVTDYKTGRNREKAKSSLQLALYTEALKRNAVSGIEGKPGSARLHYLRFAEEPLEGHLFSSQELSRHLKTLEKVATGIRKREFIPNKGRHCNFCDYKDFLCPAWEES